MHFHVIQNESVEGVYQTELQHLQGTFDIYLNKQLQTLPYISRIMLHKLYFIKQN